MSCPGKQRRVSQYLEGSLSRHEMGRVGEHLAVCTACRRLRAEYLALGAELRELPEPLLPQELPRRAVERWAARRAAATAGARRSPFAVVAALGAASASVGFVVAVLSHSVAPSPRSRSSEAKPLRLVLQPSARPDGPAPRPTAPPTRAGGRRRAIEGQRASGFASDGAAPSVRLDSARQSRAARRGHRAPGRGRDAAHGVVDDLSSMNDGDPRVRRSARSRLPDAWERLASTAGRETTGRDDFIRVPFPRLADASDRLAVTAAESYRREAAVVDARLARPATVQQKATALSDLCERLRADTGIALLAGPSVADEKVTIFCEKTPLRDVMRQLSRPFGYTWIRSGKPGEYKYELVQDLRSQLLEEELRNRDRNEALLALDQEIQRYRPYLSLSPDEALARSKTAPPAEKKLLETLASYGWAAFHLYPRLSAQEMAALRAGEELKYRMEPMPGERPLPADLARGALQPFRDWYLTKREEGYALVLDKTAPGALPVPACPEARAMVTLKVVQTELGHTALDSYLEYETRKRNGEPFDSCAVENTYAAGISPAVLKPDNGSANARLAGDPSLRARVSVRPQPSCRAVPAGNSAEGSAPAPLTTTAEVLEALHRATGMPIVADYYTRLYKPETVSARDLPLFDALSRLADAMRTRWSKDGLWLQFRSTSYYDDRLKEVPNRLLEHWSAARRHHGALTLDDLVEIAQLPDAQLDGGEMAQSAQACWNLAEWGLASNGGLRPHLRFMAGLTPEQRQEAMTASGLPFSRMSLAQQQQFLARALGFKAPPLQSLDDMSGAVLRVQYTQPGEFQWGEGAGSYTHWRVPLASGRRVPRPLVQARTREAALQAVRQVDLPIREALLQAARRGVARLAVAPRTDATLESVEEMQVVPTKLDLTFAYLPGPASPRPIHVQCPDSIYNVWP